MKDLVSKLPRALLATLIVALGTGSLALASYVVNEHLAADAQQSTDIRELGRTVGALAASTKELAVATSLLKDMAAQNAADVRELRAEMIPQVRRTERVLARVEQELDKRADVR